jgi:hypothetical protein
VTCSGFGSTYSGPSKRPEEESAARTDAPDAGAEASPGDDGDGEGCCDAAGDDSLADDDSVVDAADESVAAEADDSVAGVPDDSAAGVPDDSVAVDPAADDWSSADDAWAAAAAAGAAEPASGLPSVPSVAAGDEESAPGADAAVSTFTDPAVCFARQSTPAVFAARCAACVRPAPVVAGLADAPSDAAFTVVRSATVRATLESEAAFASEVGSNPQAVVMSGVTRTAEATASRVTVRRNGLRGERAAEGTPQLGGGGPRSLGATPGESHTGSRSWRVAATPTHFGGRRGGCPAPGTAPAQSRALRTSIAA